MTLSQKETELLKDLKSQEQLCVDKYKKHSETACDPQLKNLFSQIAATEQHHLDTVTEIASGQTPSPSSSGEQGTQQTFSQYYSKPDSQSGQNECFKSDNYLCSDVLSTEKHASHLYDTCIFEFSDESLRTSLGQIQRQEQNHGKMIYDYMSTNNMYS